MKKILFLLGVLLCSLNVIGAERISTGYCEGRGKILDKQVDEDSYFTISTTYKLCRINGIKYTNIRVDRTAKIYNANTNIKLGLREDYTGKNNCVAIDYDKRILEIYRTNADEC